MSNVVQQIQIDASEILQFINSILPPLEAAIPAVAAAGGPIGLGASLAAGLLPLLSKIPIGPVFTVEVQQDILTRVQAINLLDFSRPEWQKSTQPQPVPGPAPQPPA